MFVVMKIMIIIVFFSAMKPLIESSTPEAVKEFAVKTLKTAHKLLKDIGNDLEKYSKRNWPCRKYVIKHG